jgi:hypothetical protein
MHRRITAACAAIVIALLAITPGIAAAQAIAPARPAILGAPDAPCQFCGVHLQNVATGFNLGDNPQGIPIVNASNSNSSQLWDIRGPVNGSNNLYVIFSANTNMILTHNTGCTSDGGSYAYCATLTDLAANQSASADQEWYESVSPVNGDYSFEGKDTQRGLQDPCGCVGSLGDQAVLYPWNPSSSAQQWFIPGETTGSARG